MVSGVARGVGMGGVDRWVEAMLPSSFAHCRVWFFSEAPEGAFPENIWSSGPQAGQPADFSSDARSS